MFKRINKAFLIGLLSTELICGGCVHAPTISKPAYVPFTKGQAIDYESLNKIRQDSPKDAVFADLLQAFALMRSGDITNIDTRKEILGLLTTSVSSFEDMTDPVNFSMAFSADEDKPFRGRPHERMFASTMAAVFLMGENKCAMALPYLRNAEFLDARFQKLPFGTDAPLIYALMYRCLEQQNASKSDIARAADGVFRSVRFLTLQETLIDVLVKMAESDLRSMAVANRLAYMIYEISIYHSLITAPDSFDVAAIVDDAAKHASIFISTMSTYFEDEYKVEMKPFIDELSKVYGMNNQNGQKYLEELAFESVSLEAKHIGDKLNAIFRKSDEWKAKINDAEVRTRTLTDKILKASSAEKMAITFSGVGPSIKREGSYDEVSVVVPSPEGSIRPAIRQKKVKVNTGCGFHRSLDGDFSVVLCKPNVTDGAQVEVMPSLELLSLSRKATTAQGRKFEKVLKGRAQFRAATEKVAEVSAWSAFFLFYLGSQMASDCQRRNAGEACYGSAMVIWAIAGVTAVFSGTVWLIGRSTNPAADSRYIHLMYESAWVSI